VECERLREAISARLDGEDPGVLPAAVDAHLRRCVACRAWEADVAALARTTRVAPADPVPDLTAPILARARTRRPDDARHARLALTFVGLFQLGLALPVLFGADVAASLHVAHELASWEVALAIGFLVAAARPDRAWGMLPLVGALVGCLLATTAADVVDGHAGAGETLHVLEVIGLGCLWVLAGRPGARPRHRARAAA
jgi:predicted anti-sigma-YlaC factor YlaD